MQRWLGWIELELEELAAHLERRLLHERLESELPEARRRFPAPAEEVLTLLASESVFGGEIPELSRDFGLRAVVPEPEDVESRSGEALRQILEAVGVQEPGQLPEALADFGVSDERAAWLLNVEILYRLYQEDYVTKSMPARALKEMFAELTRYQVLTAAFPSEDIAREALCCIQMDGQPFERVATMAQADCRAEAVFGSALRSIPFGERFLAARPGDTFGPEGQGGRFLLGQLVSRVEPDLSQPDVVQRLTVRIIERSLRRTVSERVYLPPSVYHPD
jgi:hypothetical protein